MLRVIENYRLDGEPVDCRRYGSGHINRTYLVVTNAPHRYILQRINRTVFTDVPALMENIHAVTKHLSRQDPDPNHVLTLLATKGGCSYCRDGEGEYWRVYEFANGGISLDSTDSPEVFYQSAVAFGRFQNMLQDFPAETLHETIAHFHDTPKRYRDFHAAVAADKAGRRRGVEREIAFMLEHEEEGAYMMRLFAAGDLPLRVTHNDTKLNNVILNAKDHSALCVIDLDTVMPGLAANDFGDSIRFGANTAAEDEKELEKVSLSLPLYEAFAHGFLDVCGAWLTRPETETLPMGAKLMTLENGVRFLTDYLQGDTYFKVARPEHNLDRTRTQIALIQDMERKWDRMNAIIAAHRRA